MKIIAIEEHWNSVNIRDAPATQALPTREAVNCRYRARPGWDPVTGWGSPNAQVLVPLLARS